MYSQPHWQLENTTPEHCSEIFEALYNLRRNRQAIMRITSEQSVVKMSPTVHDFKQRMLHQKTFPLQYNLFVRHFHMHVTSFHETATKCWLNGAPARSAGDDRYKA
jgi:hypothetical protein